MKRMNHNPKHLASLIAAAALLCLPAADADAQAQLVYDSGTGTLTIDPNGLAAGISGYALELDGGAGFVFDTGQFSPVIPGSFAESTGTSLDEIGLAASLTSSASVGAVLPTGLTLTQLNDALITKEYETGLGGGVGDFAVVPEPSSIAALLLASGLLARRRRC